jgi:cyclopropane fatty-acyl-phospholipid synthase-like methyltransferase
MMSKTKEPHNQIQFDRYAKQPVLLGPYTSHMWREDPKHLGFLFARYKFVSKMLTGKKEVLEIGCGDAVGTPLVAKEVGKVHCIDWEPLLLDDNRSRLMDFPNIDFCVLDITKSSFKKQCDAAFALDVIEHIAPRNQDAFLTNICKSLTNDGICIIGTPNVTASEYASIGSRAGHINLQNYKGFLKFLKKYFVNGFLFSMNDEIVHTGYYPMAQYLIGMGVGVKK